MGQQVDNTQNKIKKEKYLPFLNIFLNKINPSEQKYYYMHVTIGILIDKIIWVQKWFFVQSVHCQTKTKNTGVLFTINEAHIVVIFSKVKKQCSILFSSLTDLHSKLIYK